MPARLQLGPQLGHGLRPPLLIAQPLQRPHALYIPAHQCLLTWHACGAAYTQEGQPTPHACTVGGTSSLQAAITALCLTAVPLC